MEPKGKILETVLDDIKTPTKTSLNKTQSTSAKVKKKRRASESVSSKPKHIHHRAVGKEVAGNRLDKIKEETDVATESSDTGETAEPAPTNMKINKILVRTPLVDIDNGLNRGDSDLNSEDLNVYSDRNTGGKRSPPKIRGPDREVSFSVQSEASTAGNRPASRRVKRPKSSARFTKEDLELFLPRKGFFSSHDKALVEAGHHVDTHQERQKPNWRAILKMHTMEELYPVKKEEPAAQTMFGLKDDDSESEDELFSLEKTETLVSKEGTKRRSKTSAKRAGNPEREEYKPLYDYLKYINENPDEYVSATKFTTKNLEYKHPNTMVRMARIFRRGSNVRNSIYLHALCGLKPAGLDSGGQNTAQDESEMQKLKGKAEVWLKGLTTQQYLKAKDLALKDMGEEDVNYSKWWLAFKSCQYLRVPKHVGQDGS